MAAIQTGQLISEIRGKVGELFYSRNAHGAFVGNWSVPTNPNTVRQQLVRNAVAFGNISWQTLDQETKRTWVNWASSRVNNLSISRKPLKVAYNEYIGRIINRAIINESNLNINPAGEIPYPVAFDIEVPNENELVLNYELTANYAKQAIVISAGLPMSAGINYPNKSLLKVISVIKPTAAVDSYDMFTDYASMYTITSADIGKKIFFEVWLIDKVNYTASVKQRFVLTINSDLVEPIPTITAIGSNYTENGTSVSVTMPRQPNANEMILVFVGRNSNGAINGISGFSNVLNINVSPVRIRVMSRIAIGSESATITVAAPTSTNLSMICLYLSNAPLNMNVGNIGNNVQPSAGTSIAAASDPIESQPNTRLFALLNVASGVINPACDESFTEITRVIVPAMGGASLVLFSKISEAAITPNPTISWTNNSVSRAAVFQTY